MGFLINPYRFGITAGTEAAAFLARTSGLDATHTNAYIVLINGLVADGIWSKLDLLYIYATQNSTTALLNLVSTSFNGVANGSPAFTTDRGFTGVTGSSTVYINTGLNCFGGSSKYTLNSAHLSTWSLTDGGIAAADIGNAITGQAYVIIKLASDGNTYIRINSGSNAGQTVANAVATGHYIGNRSASGAAQGYKNGSLTLTDTTSVSNFVPNLNIYSLGYNSNGTAVGSGRQFAMESIGSSLTAGDVPNFYNRLRTYMTTVGVP